MSERFTVCPLCEGAGVILRRVGESLELDEDECHSCYGTGFSGDADYWPYQRDPLPPVFPSFERYTPSSLKLRKQAKQRALEAAVRAALSYVPRRKSQ